MATFTISGGGSSVTVESNVPIAQADLERLLARWAQGVGVEMVNLTHRPGPRSGGRGTPVDTGLLSGSMAYNVTDDNRTIQIGTNVEYGIYVEEGTSRANYGLGRGVGAHMLRNAVVDAVPFAEDYLKFLLENN